MQLTAAIAKTPGFVGVNSDLDCRHPSVNVDIDRDRAAALGVSPVGHRNRAGCCLRRRADFADLRPANQYWVMLEVAAEISEPIV